MSTETQKTATFEITKALIEGYHKQGYTAKEMAQMITDASNIKCSVGTVNKAAEHFNINMRAKPRKNGFTFESVNTEAPSAQAPILEGREEVSTNTGTYQF